jgi:cyclopropane fatty-acyl-phospholipid synthase-like methyltransferase
MKIEYKDHYDEKYWTQQKEYKDSNGEVKRYSGPSLAWDGFETIAQLLSPLLPDGDLLDIGCGGGHLTALLSDFGVRAAYGVDVSEYAAKNCVSAMQGRIKVADITTSPELLGFPKQFDVVMSTDLMEHIYSDQIDDTFEWMKSRLKTNGYMFLLIAVASHKGEEFIHERGKEVPLDREAQAISGHIAVRLPNYWVKFFRTHEMTIRYDLMWKFQAERDHIEWFRNMPAWGGFCTYFLQKQ